MSRSQMTLRALLLAGASGLLAANAGAQEAGAPPAEQPEEEEIIIVGSQIRGAQVAGALPVTVINEEALAAISPGSGDELFRSIPQAGDVTFNEARLTGGINDARGDTASINLRGIGTGNTLMLLNGRRMTLHPAIQVENLVPVATVNTNAIPVSGVRRIEVLRDGASAIYGTDAVAGVINTVLRSNVDGLRIEFEAAAVANSGKQDYDVSFEVGRDFNDNRSNLSIFGSATFRDPLFASEREFSRDADMRALIDPSSPFAGDTDFRNDSTLLPWGEFRRLTTDDFAPSTTTASYNGVAMTSSGVFHVQPSTNDGCIVPLSGDVCFDNGTVATTGSDANLRYNDNEATTLYGEIERVNLFGFLNHEFDNGIEFFGEAGFFVSDYVSYREQETNLSTQRLIVPAEGYWNPFGPVGSANRLPNLTGVLSTGVPLELEDYRPVDAGPLRIGVEQYVTRYLGGVRGEWHGWDWETAYVYSRAETDDTMRQPSLTLFQEALGRTDASAYNPFNGGDPDNPREGDSSPNPREVIDSFMVDVSRVSHTSMALWDFRVSRPDLFEIWGGNEIGMAAGVELRRETYGDDRDPRLDGTITFTDLAGVETGSDVMGASPTPDTSGARNVQSVWLEFAVPLVSPDMNVPLVHSIETQLAVRYENYSLFGDVAKPKVALAWRPFESLMLRSAWSQGFRAPNLPQLHERGILRSNTRDDWIRCAAVVIKDPTQEFDCGDTQSVQSNRSGSEELTPEESENFTYGVVFEPRFMPEKFGRLTLTADYWNVKQTDVIGILGDANAITLDYLLRIVNDPSQPFNPNVIRAAPTAEDIALFDGTGIAPVGEIIQVVDNYRNLTPREVDGYDIGVFYEVDDTPLGDWNVNLNLARLLTFFQEPGAEQQALLDAQAAGIINPVVPIVGAESLIEQNGRPKWRASATVTWRAGNWGAGYYTSYVGPVDDTSAFLADGTRWRVDSFQTHNLYLQYTFEELLNDVRLRIGARNITDEQPPLADSDTGFIGDLHSARGRTIYASIRADF